jgi:mannose-6-phosphate isomerase-like protein (cupin superfamily)
MRARILGTILILVVTAAVTRQLSAQNPPPALKLFASAADVTAMIAKAKAERKPDQPNFIQPIVGLAPYTANLEHRVAGIPAPASVHEREAEMFYVVEGSGTLVTGGKLKDEKRTNAENLTGRRRRHAAENRQRRLGNGGGEDPALVPADRRHDRPDVDPSAARADDDLVEVRAQGGAPITSNPILAPIVTGSTISTRSPRLSQLAFL